MGIFGNAFSGWHLLIILAVVVLLFGASKLPALAKGVGQSVRIFRGEINSLNEEKKADEAAAEPAKTVAAETPVDRKTD